MNDLIGFLNWFTGNQWISLVAVVLAVVAIVYTAIPVHAARKQRRLEAARNRPGVKATINRTPSVDNWRSIQLHITPPEAQAQTYVFQKSGWRIRNAKLISPRNTELAFARDDDHSLKGPIVGISGRLMSGRADGHLQPFAMEFFIRFPGTPIADQGKRAKFRVQIWRKQPYDPGRTVEVWAEVPLDAESKRTE